MAKKVAGEIPVVEIEKMTFEQALAALETIVQALEQGDLPLEKSIELSNQGQRLAAHCSSQLGAAELRVTQLKADEA
jgi:exodeoxyribonuclease VII small subunit